MINVNAAVWSHFPLKITKDILGINPPREVKKSCREGQVIIETFCSTLLPLTCVQLQLQATSVLTNAAHMGNHFLHTNTDFLPSVLIFCSKVGKKHPHNTLCPKNTTAENIPYLKHTCTSNIHKI